VRYVCHALLDLEGISHQSVGGLLAAGPPGSACKWAIHDAIGRSLWLRLEVRFVSS
jgi:hypothetical protein